VELDNEVAALNAALERAQQEHRQASPYVCPVHPIAHPVIVFYCRIGAHVSLCVNGY